MVKYTDYGAGPGDETMIETFFPTFRKKVHAVLVAASLIVGGGVAYAERHPINDAIHHYVTTGNTMREQRIEDALHAVGVRAAVHCVGAQDFNPNAWPVRGEFTGEVDPIPFVGKPFGYMRLSQAVCYFANTLANNPDGQQHSINTATAVSVISREASEIMGDGRGLDTNMAKANCRGIQGVEKLAEALGATPDQAASLANIAAAYPQYTVEPNTPYLTQCTDGGRYDLNPNQPGYFPGQPQQLPASVTY